MSQEALWRAVREPLRLLVLAVIPLALVYFGQLDYQWAGLLVVALRFLDKYLHELGKERSTARSVSPLVRGLTRF